MSMLLLVATIFVFITDISATVDDDPALNQLPEFKSGTKGPIGRLTTGSGALVEYNDTLMLNTPDFAQTEFFMDALGHQMAERIPERIVHPKGPGAFGYFVVTHHVTDICRAALFEKVGKKTPVFVRFSQSRGDKGESDLILDSRGFAVKFYTDEGNFDIVGFHTPMFIYKDPFIFVPATKVGKRNPVTNLKDPNMMWDFITQKPETLSFFLFLHGDDGIPDGYRYMPGFSVHTYQVYNKFGESYFVRFHILPKTVKNLSSTTARSIGCVDPDYSVRDLYNAIKKGNYPSWSIKIQVLSAEDVKNCEFDPLDITKTLPEDKYPLRPLGKLVLNRNPTNYFAQVESAAFCPSNLVRGILGAPDNAFKSRQLAYKMAQRYRLGVNFQKIEVNCPLNRVLTYDRDGYAPLGSNGGSAPNYYPNSFNGPVPYVDEFKPRLIKINQDKNQYDFQQATERYIQLTGNQKRRLVDNIVETLSLTSKSVQERVIALFKLVNAHLAIETLSALAASR